MMGSVDREKKALLEIWRELDSEKQRTLLSFARFLASEQAGESDKAVGPVIPEVPLEIPRPATESAVAGLKRLKKRYPMIEADEGVLAEASRILMGKVMGVADREVIDQLEEYFARCYQNWLAKRG
ncbi:MAG: hypothetical protein HQL98_03635 [Magnetococcales bacterium]|nr:hypothetical protein [Magnetococcales bacterium]